MIACGPVRLADRIENPGAAVEATYDTGLAAASEAAAAPAAAPA
jgi:hypothetical protein